MPVVPRYDNFQVSPNSQPTTRLEAPNMPDVAGQQMQRMGQGMMQAGGQLGQVALDIQNDVNKVRLDDATNQAIKLDTDLRAEMLQLQGKNALERPDGLSLPDEYGKKMKEGLEKIKGGLGNEAQKQAFGHVGSQISGKLYSLATDHMIKQQEVFQKETWKTTIDVATDRAVLLFADVTERQNSLAAIGNTVKEMAKRNGWDKDTTDRAYIEATSPLHAGTIKAMITNDQADQAKAYYDENSAGMTLQARAQVQTQIADAGSSKMAETTADEIWLALGPKDPNAPVSIFDMEKEMRARLANSPDAMKKGIAALRERASAFNAQQSEVRAGGINEVWGMIDAGAGMRKVRNSQSWLNLPETDRHNITKTLEAEAATRAGRQASEASRDLANMQRSERMAYMRNGDSYLTDSDPNVLAKMSRGQVEAKRSLYGMEPTQHLLNRWDELQKPGKVAEAKMDKQDFDMIADSLGLPVFARSNSEKEKRALGTLQYRVEQLIDQKQRTEKRTLQREEKMDLMRREMAQQVTVDGGMFSRERQVPVIQLTPEQARDVVVPSGERAKIIEALKYGNNKEPNNPYYAPTEDNVRRMYILKMSPAGGLIPNAQ